MYTTALQSIDELSLLPSCNPQEMSMTGLIQQVRHALVERKTHARTRGQHRMIDTYLLQLGAPSQKSYNRPIQKKEFPFNADLIGVIGSFLPAKELGAMQQMNALARVSLDDNCYKAASVGKELDLLKLRIEEWLNGDPARPFVFPLLHKEANLTDLTSLQPLFTKASSEQLHTLVQSLVAN
jgi:hypothetical protein